MAKGYALQNIDRTIDIKTVSESERAVMVNAIVSQAGMFVDKTWTDEKIERTFLLNVRGVVVPVNVTTKE